MMLDLRELGKIRDEAGKEARGPFIRDLHDIMGSLDLPPWVRDPLYCLKQENNIDRVASKNDNFNIHVEDVFEKNKSGAGRPDRRLSSQAR